MTEWQWPRATHWGEPVPADLRHGQSSYVDQVYGCDCPACLPSGRRRGPWNSSDPNRPAAMTHADRQMKLRATKRGKPVPPGTKHGDYAYRVYRCRCDVCIAGKAELRRRHRAAWRHRAIGDWQDNVVVDGQKTTVLHWPPRGEGMWECPDCLEKFPHRPPKEAS